MRTAARVIVASVLVLLSVEVVGQTESFPDPKIYEEKKQIFRTFLTEKFSPEERAEATRKCLAKTGGDSGCTDWYGSETWYGLGWETCNALRQGYSRQFIMQEVLGPDEDKLGEAIFDTAVEILCPKDVLEVYRREYEEQISREAATDEEDSEEWLDPEKDQLFIERMIEKLPEPQRSEYRRTCGTHSKRCVLWGFSAYGDGTCELLREGYSRRELIEGGEQFFDRATQKAIVDTAIELICPQFKGKN